MSSPDSQLMRSVDVVYDAVLAPDRWRDALDEAAALAGAHGSILFSRDPGQSGLEITVMSNSFDEGAGALYLGSLLSDDELRWDQLLDEVPALTTLEDTEIWPDRDQFREMPSTRWLRQRHFNHRSATRLCPHGGWKDTLTAIYVRGRGPINTEEKQRLGLLLPHLARALEIRRPFALLKNRYEAILSVLDRLGIGVLVLVDGDHILLSNTEADRILDAKDALRRRADGRLGFVASMVGSDAATEFEYVVAQVRSNRMPQGQTLYLPRSDGSVPYIADVATFREDGLELGSPTVGALIWLVDPANQGCISTAALSRVYALSAAETEVTDLIGRGLTSEEIADTRNVSLNTVKAQCKAILRKTACRNRVDLIRRAVSIAPPLIDGRPPRRD